MRKLCTSLMWHFSDFFFQVCHTAHSFKIKEIVGTIILTVDCVQHGGLNYDQFNIFWKSDLNIMILFSS